MAGLHRASTSPSAALRWQRLVAPIGHVRYPAMLAYLLVGYLANNVLPARLGELVRSHYLGDREGLSPDHDARHGRRRAGRRLRRRRRDRLGGDHRAERPGHRRERRPGRDRGGRPAGRRRSRSGSPPIGCPAPSGSPPRPSAGRGSASSRGKLRGGLAVAGRPRTLVEALVLSVIAWGATVLVVRGGGPGDRRRADDRPGVAPGRRASRWRRRSRRARRTSARSSWRRSQIGKAVGVADRHGVRPRAAGPRGDPRHHLGGRPRRAGPARLAAGLTQARLGGAEPEVRGPLRPLVVRPRPAKSYSSNSRAAAPARFRIVRNSSAYASYVSAISATASRWAGRAAAARASARLFQRQNDRQLRSAASGPR